jgi:hypothetical protein
LDLGPTDIKFDTVELNLGGVRFGSKADMCSAQADVR